MTHLARVTTLPARPRPLRLQRIVGNVPGEINTFVGRERELALLRELQAETRLLTLVGPGGVGKTRLALRLEADLSDVYRDGTWLVDLSPVTEAALVPQVVGDVLGIHQPATQTWPDELARQLRARSLLLVLDNCEHLILACAELVDRLARECPNLSVVATSLQPLGVAGETTWRVPPLVLPVASTASFAEIADSEAVQFFVARVRAHLPDFELSEQNARAVAEICRRLDGLPLALELVAARVESLGVAEVASRLTHRFDLVSVTATTAPARHRTLHAALEWSCSLLTMQELILLRQLAVFAGGWTLQAAEAVCGDDHVITDEAVVDTLSRLVTKSLIVADHDGMTVRYRLLETVRAYALNQLSPAGESRALQRRHASYMLQLAERLPSESLDAARAALLRPEEDNVRAALAWAIDGQEAELGQRLVVAAWPLWMFSGHFQEALGWFDRVLALPAELSATSTRALALGLCGMLRVLVGEYDVAVELGEAAMELARGNTLYESLVLEMLGNAALQRGDLERARLLHTDSAERKRSVSSSRRVSNLLQLGLIETEYGALDRVRQLIAEIEVFGRTHDQPLVLAGGLHLRALVASGEGAPSTAVRLLEQALERRRSLADQQGVVKSLTTLGHVQMDLGHTDLAVAAFAEAIQGAGRSGERIRIIRALEGFARCCAERDAEAALQLASAADTQRQAMGAVPWPKERQYLSDWLGATRRALGEPAFARAWEAGQVLSLAEAVALAESLMPPPHPAPRVENSELSPRERQVAVLIARGLTNKQVAVELVVSPATVRSHVEHILAKLDLRSRAQIAVWASQQGLLAAQAESD